MSEPAIAGTAPGEAAFAAILAAIATANTCLLTAHVRPDGDAIGSVVGLARSLRKAGKRVDLLFADPPPANFRFLLADEVLFLPGQEPAPHDLVLVLDTGEEARTGVASELAAAGGLVVNIDHHATNTGFGDLVWVDPGASSTCEMITTLLVDGGLPFDADVAEPLYLGLCTDTRFFQNETLGVGAFRTAVRLYETGFDAGPILRRLGSRSLTDLRLLGIGLAKLALAARGDLAWLALSQAELKAVGARMANVWSCGIIGQTASVEGTRAGLVMVEGEDGRTYCEFRGRAGLDVSRWACHFGGGGHRAASGCSIGEPFDPTVERVLAYVTGQLETTAVADPEPAPRVPASHPSGGEPTSERPSSRRVSARERKRPPVAGAAARGARTRGGRS